MLVNFSLHQINVGVMFFYHLYNMHADRKLGVEFFVNLCCLNIHVLGHIHCYCKVDQTQWYEYRYCLNELSELRRNSNYGSSITSVQSHYFILLMPWDVCCVPSNKANYSSIFTICLRPLSYMRLLKVLLLINIMCKDLISLQGMQSLFLFF